MAAPSLGHYAAPSLGMEHGAEGNTAGSGQEAAGSRQKSEVRDQTSEVRGKADL